MTRTKGISIVEVMVAFSLVLFSALAIQKFISQQSKLRRGVQSTRSIEGLEEQLRRAASNGNEVLRSASLLDPKDPKKFAYEKLGTCILGGSEVCQNAWSAAKPFGMFFIYADLSPEHLDRSQATHPIFWAGPPDQPIFYGPSGEPIYRPGEPDEKPCFKMTQGSPECPIEVIAEVKTRCPAGQNSCFRSESVDLVLTIQPAKDKNGMPIPNPLTGAPTRKRFIRISHRNHHVRSGFKVRVLRIQGKLHNCVYLKMIGDVKGYPKTFQLGCGIHSIIHPPTSLIKKYLKGRWEQYWPLIPDFPKEFEFPIPPRCRAKLGFITWVPSTTRIGPRGSERITFASCPNSVPSRPQYLTNQPFGKRPCGYYVTETIPSQGSKRKGNTKRENTWIKKGELRSYSPHTNQYYEIQDKKPDPNIIVTFHDGGSWEDNDPLKSEGSISLSIEVEPKLCAVDL